MFGAEGFTELIEAWDGIGVVVRYDRPTGAWMFIALHDDTLGRPVGGCRMKVYDRPEDGLRDALRLAEGMTHKWASVDLPFGGGKSVLAIPHPMKGAARTGLFRRFGRLLDTLHGAYGTGEDLGTTPLDMAEIATVSEHVVGLPDNDDGPTDPGPFTALGVLAGMRAALRHRHGTDSLSGRTVLVEGLGHVGEPLARHLALAGASVLLSDIDRARAMSLSVDLGGSVVTPEAVSTTACDIYAPCAVGATLNAESIPRLKCGIVAGSANNQLESAEDAERLMDRGILYAPDYVINSGGAMAFGLIALGERDLELLEARVRGLEGVLIEIFEEAELHSESPLAGARRRVDRVLARGRR